MTQPLVDIDANVYQPAWGARPSRLPGKARSPAVPYTSTRPARRSPFRVSASGSPRYMAPKSSPMLGLSPSVGSKIPRKAGNATLPRRSPAGAFTISSTPRVTSLGGPPNEDRKTSAKGPSAAPQKPGRSPPADRNKPLPSPPILQYVNPLSPLKAQRTLVDAEVAGTPSSEEWPILAPENVPPKKTSPMSTASSAYSKEKAVGKDMTPIENAIASTNFTSNNIGRPATASSTLAKRVSFAGSQGTSPRDIITWDSSPMIVHAITTERDEALESPLARKVAFPRGSSKHASPATSIQGRQPSTTGTKTVTTPQRQLSKSGSTRWPLLNNGASLESPSITKPLIPKQGIDDDAAEFGAAGLDSPGDLESMSEYSPIAPRKAAAKHIINGKATGGSSSGSDTGSATVLNKCIKRLSGHSASSGLGPTLTIANDASSVILGPEEQTSGQPVALGTKPNPAPEERSLSALAGRISRQTISRMSMSISSRSSTPQLVTEEKAKSTVKIFPIRSMQPPRKHVSGPQNRSSSSPLPLPSQSPSMSDDSRQSSSYGKRSVLATQGLAVPRKVEGYKRESSRIRTLTTTYEQINKKNSVVDPQSAKTAHTKIGRPDAAGRKPSAVPRGPPTSGASKAKRLTAAGGNLESPLAQPAYRNSRQPAGKGSAVALSPQTLPVARARSEDSSISTKSSSSNSPSPALQPATLPLEEPPIRKSVIGGPHINIKSESVPEPSPRSQESRSSVSTKEEKAAAKVKSKRSFRNFFHMGNGKRVEKASKQAEDKHSSLAMTGSTLAKRFRSSATSSKLNTSKRNLAATPNTPEPRASAIQPRTVANIDREKGTSPDSMTDAPAAKCTETATVVNNIINQVSSLPSNSADRLRGLEIAEALLNSVDAYKQAKISATKAKKHARQAELNAERAGVELERLQKLCEPDFDQETVQAVKDIVKCVSMIGKEDTRSLPSGCSTPAQ